MIPPFFSLDWLPRFDFLEFSQVVMYRHTSPPLVEVMPAFKNKELGRNKFEINFMLELT
jgi:hypothetical protein